MDDVFVIGCWEPGFSEYEQLIEWRIWTQTLYAYDIKQWHMVGSVHPNGGGFTKHSSLDDAIIDCSNTTIILLEPWHGEELQYFIHPTRATYVFANAISDLVKYRDNAVSVRIPTPQPIDMFAVSCLSMVLNDRFIKNEC